MFSVNAQEPKQEQSVQGVDHVGLAVSDLKASERFFTQYAGFHVLSRDEKYPSVFLSNNSVVITLWRVTDPNRAVAFDRKHNVGLHHLALRVSSEATLNALHDTFLQDKQVKIEFAPELAGNGPNKHMMVYEPSGSALVRRALFWPSTILVEQFLGHTLSQPGTSLAEHFFSWASANGH